MRMQVIIIFKTVFTLPATARLQLVRKAQATASGMSRSSGADARHPLHLSDRETQVGEGGPAQNRWIKCA